MNVLKGLSNCMFYIAIVLVAIIWWLKLHKPICYHPSRWPLLTPTQYPCSSGLLISSNSFGKLLVEPKTLGGEHSRKSFEIVFENLGVTSTPLKCLWKLFLYYWWLG
jgi:hypothetical protein